MTPLQVRDLIKELTDMPMNSVIYIGKGCGPLIKVESDGDRYVILTPEATS